MKPSWKTLQIYQWIWGGCDGLTGLLLVLAPERTLHWMGIRHLPQSPEMVSFVGVFVLAVGLAYLTVTQVPRTQKQAAQWQTVWLVTAISRTLVASFLIWQTLSGRMEGGWAVVWGTDLSLGVLQITGLKLKWLEPEISTEGGTGA